MYPNVQVQRCFKVTITHIDLVGQKEWDKRNRGKFEIDYSTRPFRKKCSTYVVIPFRDIIEDFKTAGEIALSAILGSTANSEAWEPVIEEVAYVHDVTCLREDKCLEKK